MNSKKSSSSVTKIASEVLRNPNSSQISKSLAGSVLSQANSSNQTSNQMESIASKALQSEKYNDTTKTLAGSVLSQSNGK
jgi:PBP1b-binding outer membrane lipoprotein LpoB